MAKEAVQRLAAGSAGVSPARIGNYRAIDSKSFAGETPALPVVLLALQFSLRNVAMRDRVGKLDLDMNLET
jgi:hypothetical protein